MYDKSVVLSHQQPEPLHREDKAAASAPRALLLDPRDTVAVATANLASGERIGLPPHNVELSEEIPVGHKFAVIAIDEDDDVLKYGEVIGRATSRIRAGSHVHVHNLVGKRLPGPLVL